VDTGTCSALIFSSSSEFSVYHSNSAVQIYRDDNPVYQKKKSSLLFLLDNAFFYDSDDASEPWDLSQTLMLFCIRHGPQFLIWHQTPSGLMMQPELFVQALYMVGKFMLFFGFANTSKNPNAAKSNILLQQHQSLGTLQFLR